MREPAPSVSTLRLYLMRAMFLLNFFLVGGGVVVTFMQRTQPWDAMTGVAFSFWAALAALSAIGIRYPVAMIPILLMQMLYKTFWLLAVGLPLWAAGQTSGLTTGMLIGLGLDLIVIPWAYVFAQYVQRPGDRWR